MLPASGAEVVPQIQEVLFPFLALPPEIRNEVYSYLLPQDTSVEVRIVDSDEYPKLIEGKTIERTSLALHMEEVDEFEGDAIRSRHSYKVKTFTYASKKNEQSDSISILGVNRQIRLETLGLFYGKNTFQINDWRTLNPF